MNHKLLDESALLRKARWRKLLLNSKSFFSQSENGHFQKPEKQQEYRRPCIAAVAPIQNADRFSSYLLLFGRSMSTSCSACAHLRRLFLLWHTFSIIKYKSCICLFPSWSHSLVNDVALLHQLGKRHGSSCHNIIALFVSRYYRDVIEFDCCWTLHRYSLLVSASMRADDSPAVPHLSMLSLMLMGLANYPHFWHANVVLQSHM